MSYDQWYVYTYWHYLYTFKNPGYQIFFFFFFFYIYNICISDYKFSVHNILINVICLSVHSNDIYIYALQLGCWFANTDMIDKQPTILLPQHLCHIICIQDTMSHFKCLLARWCIYNKVLTGLLDRVG